jgi:hypothetical protein
MTARHISFEADVLSRMIQPDEPAFAQEAAEVLLSLSFAKQDLTRMRRLAKKAREGTLSEEERRQADAYERLGSLLGLLHSKARRSLGTKQP